MIMDIHQILRRLPHRYPLLLVDRVLELHDRQPHGLIVRIQLPVRQRSGQSAA